MMGNKYYYRKYELLKDVPKSPKGRILRWVGSRKKYYFAIWDSIQKDWDILYEDFKGDSYTRKEVESMIEFFKPIGEKSKYIPDFDLDLEELKEYYYFGELQTNGEDDFGRCLSEIVESENFEQEMFNLIKKLYEKKFEDNE